MPAVCNSSPLILYAKSGYLDLLPALYSKVIVPPAVQAEVLGQGAGRPGYSALVQAHWLRVQLVVGSAELARLATLLDAGEAEAIALALIHGGRLPLIIDDGRGRRVAQELGLPITGSAGLLVAAKRRNLIAHVRPLLQEVQHAGLYLSREAFHQVLVSVDESDQVGGN